MRAPTRLTTRPAIGGGAAALLAALLAACSATTTAPLPTALPATPPAAGTGAAPTPSASPRERVEVRSYLLRDERVAPVARSATGPAVAAEAVRHLLAGPTDAEREAGLGSAVPAGTRLLGIDLDGAVATVDLSGEFASGGGSASMRARVAQVVYTVTQFPNVDAVRFRVDGRAVTALGGEGLVLTDPQRRTDWEDLTPAILVESPLPFAEVSSPAQVRGTANTFEAAFHVTVTDGNGRIVYDEPAMATSGSGTRGTFEVSATLDAPRAGVGSVIVYEVSARDGSRINLVEIPVRIS